jgi:hypothetical protein
MKTACIFMLLTVTGKFLSRGQSADTATGRDTSIFGLSIGARFTFFRDENPTSLYYDLSGFIPSLWPESWKCFSRIGLFTSIDENNYEFYLQEQSANLGTLRVLDEPWVVAVKNRDSVVVANNNYLRTITAGSSHQMRLSIYPLYKITDNLFFSLQFESIYGSSERVFRDVILGSDTIFLPIDSMPGIHNAAFPYGVSEGYRLNSVSTFTGIGIFLNYRIKNIRLQILPSTGFFTNEYYYRRYDTGRIRSFTNDWFLACRFSLTESRMGIKIGGDVRGFPGDRLFSYSLYASKQFSFDKIGEFIGSK